MLTQDAIVWLHLSDLHFCEPDTGLAAYSVLQKLPEDLRAMEAKFGLSPQMIFFTGDAALGQLGVGKGRSLDDQFDEAHNVLEGVRKVFQPEIPRDHVFLVPGNHDVDWNEVTNRQTEWLDDKNRSIGDVIDLIKKGGDLWRQYAARLGAYGRFLERCGYHHLLQERNREHLIYAVTRQINGLKIGIAGFNSAWSCRSQKQMKHGDERGRLWLGGRWQIPNLTQQLEGADFKIALMHHPHSWFVQHEDPPLREDLAREFQFVLHGHEHSDWVGLDPKQHYTISGAAVFERKEGKHGFSMVRLDVRTAKVSVWLRCFDARGGGWIPRVIYDRTTDSGEWPLGRIDWLWKKLGLREPSLEDDDAQTDEYLQGVMQAKTEEFRRSGYSTGELEADEDALDQHQLAQILHWRARSFRNWGDFAEALEPLRRSLEIARGESDFRAAAIRARHLAETLLLCGKVEESVKRAREAVQLADRSGLDRERVIERAVCGNTLNQSGKRDEALGLFNEAEALLRRFEPGQQSLYSLWGYMHLDALLEVDPAEVLKRANKILEPGQRGALISLKTLDEPIIRLARGKALLRQFERGETAMPAQLICEELGRAVEGLLGASYQDDLVRGLIAHAAALGLCWDLQAANRRIIGAIRIAEPGQMLLHLADVRLEQARLFKDKEALTAARELIKGCGYFRRLGELQVLEKEAESWDARGKAPYASPQDSGIKLRFVLEGPLESFAGPRFLELLWRFFGLKVASVTIIRVDRGSTVVGVGGEPAALEGIKEKLLESRAMLAAFANATRLTRFVWTFEGQQYCVTIGAPMEGPQAAAAGPEMPGRNRVAPTRLPRTRDELVGREDELRRLIEAWRNPGVHVLTIVAWGGVGKTSLVSHWQGQLAVENYGGADYFDWSFYSQGATDIAMVSAGSFIAAALTFFGDPDTAESGKSPWDKGARLAELLCQRRALLVLDGLEPLQYPPNSPLTGQLKDPALQALLKGLAAKNAGLCVVNSRQALVDLAAFQSTAPKWQLEHLSVAKGVELLRTLGVRGPEADLNKLVQHLDGHALTLDLMGRYLVEACGGDVRRRDRVRFDEADKTVQGGHAFRVVAAYERWFRTEREHGDRPIAILRLLGLFDRPADPGCLIELCQEPVIPGLTEPLVGLAEEDWNVAVRSLAKCGLVSERGTSEPESTKNLRRSLDAHPLIREYFAAQLRELDSGSVWRLAHRRLYEHLGASLPAISEPAMQDLETLYQAVAHGCEAGLQREALMTIYLPRIHRCEKLGDDVFYATRKRGAFGMDLQCLTRFFKTPWYPDTIQGLDVWEQGFILHWTASRLRALGRFDESLELFRRSLQIAAKHGGDAQSSGVAAIRARHLSETCLLGGKVDEAVQVARQAVEYANACGNPREQIIELVVAGNALWQHGEPDHAGRQFAQAEILLQQCEPGQQYLYSLWGYMYLDLLSETAGPEKVLRRCATILDPANPKGECISLGLLDRPIILLARAKAGLGQFEAGAGGLSLDGLREEVEAAVAGLREAGYQEDFVRGLLARAWICRLQSRLQDAHEQLDQAKEIADRGPMRLHWVDIALERAEVALCENDPVCARALVSDAEKLAVMAGYRRRLPRILRLQHTLQT